MNLKTCTTLAAMAACAGLSHAFIIVSDLSAMNPTNTLTDFEDMPIASRGTSFTYDGLEFLSARGMSAVDLSLWPVNGTHIEHMALFPRLDGEVRAPVFPIVINLPHLASEFGFGWFDPNFAGNVAHFYDAQGNILASVEPTPGPKWGVHSDYIGVKFESDVIARVKIVPVDTGDVFAIDNISWSAIGEPIPAPASLALAGAGLLGVARRRR